MRSMIRLWHRSTISLVFVFSPKFNFYFLPQTSLKKHSVQGSLQSQKTGECSNCSTKVSLHLGPQVLSVLPGMVVSQYFLESLTVEQNRYCALLQGSSEEEKIHRLSSVWRGSFWIHDLDSFRITHGDECCKQDRGYIGRGIIQFFIFLISFHDWWCYSLVPTELKKCSSIEKEPTERGNRYQQHLPSLPMGFQQGVMVADSSHTLIPVCFFCHNFSDGMGQWSAMRHLMCHLLLGHAIWAKLCNGVSLLKQKAEVCVL